MPAILEVPRITEDQVRKHQAKMQKVREAKAARIPEMVRCLDADHAASLEARKPRQRYAIKCTVQESDPRLKRMTSVEKSGEVEAQNEDDAWAIFCDRWKVRVGPNHCNRTIQRVGPARAEEQAA